MPLISTDGSCSRYRAVVTNLLNMGRVNAANATGDAIRRWRPRYVLLVGIAAGVPERGARLGDVLVSDQVIDYELQKLTPEGPEMRWEVHRVDPRLLAAARGQLGDAWLHLVQEPRPQEGRPERLIGPIATGDKVVALKSTLDVRFVIQLPASTALDKPRGLWDLVDVVTRTISFGP